jgi:hypothetical protein
MHVSLKHASSAEARAAAVNALQRQAKEIEGMFSEDEGKRVVEGGVASYVHDVESALEAGAYTRPLFSST